MDMGPTQKFQRKLDEALFTTLLNIWMLHLEATDKIDIDINPYLEQSYLVHNIISLYCFKRYWFEDYMLDNILKVSKVILIIN